MNARLGRSCLVILATLTLGSTASAQSQGPEPGAPWKFAVHAGWWDVGFDVATPQGVLLGVGVPWVLYAPVLDYAGRDGVVALDASAGYGFSLAPRTQLRAKLQSVWSYDWGTPCGGSCEERTHRLYFFPVAGLRQRLGGESPQRLSGPIIGVDLALAVFALHNSDGETSSGWHVKNIPFWAGPAFSQVYAGYEW